MNCAGIANRKRYGAGPMPCGQAATFYARGKWWCWYHNPDSPHKFGQGYQDAAAKTVPGGT